MADQVTVYALLRVKNERDCARFFVTSRGRYNGSVQAYDETQAEFIMLVRRVDDLIAARRL